MMETSLRPSAQGQTGSAVGEGRRAAREAPGRMGVLVAVAVPLADAVHSHGIVLGMRLVRTGISRFRGGPGRERAGGLCGPGRRAVGRERLDTAGTEATTAGRVRGTAELGLAAPGAADSDMGARRP